MAKKKAAGKSSHKPTQRSAAHPKVTTVNLKPIHRRLDALEELTSDLDSGHAISCTKIEVLEGQLSDALNRITALEARPVAASADTQE